MPPDGDSDCNKGKEAQSRNTPYDYCKRNGDVECSDYCAGGDFDSVPAEMVVPFAGQQCAVNDKFYCFHNAPFTF